MIYDVKRLGTTIVQLGRRGENLANAIGIDVQAWLDAWPDAEISVIVLRPGESTGYPAENVSIADGVLSWVVTNVETAFAGVGSFEVRATSGDVLKKSVVTAFEVCKCISCDIETDEPPEPAKPWFDQTKEAATAAEESAAEAKAAQTAATTHATNAEASAEEAARAAAGVKAIVAGNEAYTKGESDNLFSPAINCVAAGEVITVSDSANRPLAGLTIYGKTTQDGTPTPESPIDLVNSGDSGSITVKVCGRNIAHKATVKAYPTNKTPDIIAPYTGKITLSAKPLSGDVVVNYAIRQNGELTNVNWLRATDGNGVWYNAVLDVSGFTGAWVYEIAAPARTWEDVILSIGEVRMTDELYAALPQTQSMTASTPNGLPGIPVSNGGNYIDANGQQRVCDEIDFTRKAYVQRVKTIVFTGTENLVQSSSRASAYSYADPALDFSNWGHSQKIVCTHFRTEAYQDAANASNNTVTTYVGSLGNTIRFTCDEKAVPQLMQEQYAAGNPVTVYAVLATPIETALTADELTAYAAMTSQYPNTTAYNDAGASMEMAYVADTKLYIDNKFAALATAMLNP